jgi:adenylate cyclase
MKTPANENGGTGESARERLSQSDKHSRILLEVTNRLSVAKNLDEALAVLVEITTFYIKAERGTVFINDKTTGELYSRIAQGNLKREIRILNTKGVAGWVFSNNQGAIITDAYKDPRFNKAVDVRTGFRTKSILCAPLRSMSGELIGVAQLLNKTDGQFDQENLDLLEAMTEQAAIVIQGNIMIEQIEAARHQELEFLDVVSQVSSELELGPLLGKIIRTISTMLDSERATLFINDEKTNELYTEVGEGLGKNIIRFPNDVGIAGTVFKTGKPLNIPHAYADLRFNPSFDRSTGYFTRSILCMPVISKEGKSIGVSQVLNKRGGAFTKEDEKRLGAFTSQISMGIENAKLFDEVQNAMNYTQSMLSSMHDGVVTFDEKGRVKTINPSGLRILQFDREEFILKKPIDELFIDENKWMQEKLTDVSEAQDILDAELIVSGEKVSLNISILPLQGEKETPKGKEKVNMGTMLMLEDISSEKRMKSTMSRYMDPDLAEQLMGDGDDEILGGKQSVASVLFSDVRSFTTITEELGAQGTVKLLNETPTVRFALPST